MVHGAYSPRNERHWPYELTAPPTSFGHLQIPLLSLETQQAIVAERECGKAKLARRPVCKPQAENVEISNAPDGFIPAREFCNFLRLSQLPQFKNNKAPAPTVLRKLRNSEG